MEVGEAVGAHDPHETALRKRRLERRKRCGGGHGTQPPLDIGDDKAGMASNFPGQAEALSVVAVVARILKRVLRRHQPPYPVEPELAKGKQSHRIVPAMGLR